MFANIISKRENNSCAKEFLFERKTMNYNGVPNTSLGKAKFAGKTPFRSAIRTKNTSFVSMVDGMKRLKLDDSKINAESGFKFHENLSKGAFKSENTTDKFSLLKTLRTRESILERRKSQALAGVVPAMVTKVAQDRKLIQLNNLFESCTCWTAEPEMNILCVCNNNAIKAIVPESGFYMKNLKKKLTEVKQRMTDAEPQFTSLEMTFQDRVNENVENFEVCQCN